MSLSLSLTRCLLFCLSLCLCASVRSWRGVQEGLERVRESIREKDEDRIPAQPSLQLFARHGPRNHGDITIDVGGWGRLRSNWGKGVDKPGTSQYEWHHWRGIHSFFQILCYSLETLLSFLCWLVPLEKQSWIDWKDRLSKNENSVIVYSHLCRFKPVWLAFILCHKGLFFYCSYNESHWSPVLFWTPLTFIVLS